MSEKAKSKLILISPMLHQGGFERVCVTTARLLAPYYDITIVIFNDADIAFDVEGLQIVNLNIGAKDGKLQKLWNLCLRIVKMRKLKKQMKPEIAYSFGLSANLVNALSKTKNTKVWLGLRSFGDVEDSYKMRLFTKFGDKIICCSKDIERVMKDRYGSSQTAVLYNLYNVDQIRLEAEETKPPFPFGEKTEDGKSIRYLYSMGREDDLKGFWHLLKSFSLVYQEMPECRLVILGDGSFTAYKKLAKDLQIEESIHFAGMQKKPYGFLTQGEIYLLTSVIEGFPNALVEAMALSLAPISTNCYSGPAEILTDGMSTKDLDRIFTDKKVYEGEYGILIPCMDTTVDFNSDTITAEEINLAKVILDLLRNENKRKQYQEKALQRARQFDFESYTNCFLALADY